MSASGLRPAFSFVLRMHRAQAADIDDELLRLAAEAEGLEQACRVRMRRGLEDAVRADDQRRAFGGIDRLDRAARFLHLEDIVLVAVGHDGAFAEIELLRRIGRRLHLHHALFGELLEIAPAEIALHLVGRGHDGAAVAGMRLDDLALPFGIEQVGKTLRRVLGLHQIGVVGDDAEPDAEACELAVGIPVLGRIEFRDIFGNVGRQDAVALPDDEVRGIGGIHDIDGVDVAGIFLADALEHAFGAGALHPHRDPRIFGLERLGELFGDRQVGRGVVDDLTFLLRRLDQRRRDRLGRRGGRQNPGRKRGACGQCCAALQHVAARNPLTFHPFVPRACRRSWLHQSLSIIPRACL